MMEFYQRDCYSVISKLFDLICRYISEVRQKYLPHCLICKAIRHEEGDVAFYIEAAKKIKPDIENVSFPFLSSFLDLSAFKAKRVMNRI